MFSNGPGQVILKIQKMVLDASLLNTQHFDMQIKGEWNNPVAPFLTPRGVVAIEKGGLRLTLDYDRSTN